MKKKKILLVEPPFHSFMEYDRWYYPTSLALLAAILHKDGHEVYIYDADRYFHKNPETKNRLVLLKKQKNYSDNIDNFDHVIWKHFRNTLENFKPDIVGVSIFTSKLRSALNTLKVVKAFNSNILTCVGGAHVTASYNTLEDNQYIDALFVGYSDNSFIEWINSASKNRVVKGETDKQNFQNLPYARRQALLFNENYTQKDLSYIITSRGCVGRCVFCSNTFLWKGRPVFRSSDSIRQEVNELINEWGSKKILLGDSSNSDIPRENMRVANVLKEFGLPWTTNIRWATVNKKLLEHFMECGCTGLSVGLETGSEKMLKLTKKGTTVKQIREKAKMINELGLDWHLFTIVGFPDETIDDINMTQELALEINPTAVSVNSFSPLPGTEAYNNIEGLSPEIASSVNQLNPQKCFSNKILYDQFTSKFTNIIDAFEKHNMIENRNRQD